MKVKILDLIRQKNTVTRSRRRLKQSTYIVADVTTTMHLSVWGETEIEIGKWYDFENVSVRLFDEKPCLSTTVQTTVSLTDDLGNCAEVRTDQRETVVGEIIDTEVKVEYMCPQFHTLHSVNHETQMSRCLQCAAYCKTSKIMSTVRGHITIDVGEENKKMVLENDVFCQLLGLQTGVKYDSDQLASKILTQEKLSVEMYEGLILSAAFVGKEERSVSQQCSMATCSLPFQQCVASTAANLTDGSTMCTSRTTGTTVLSSTQSCSVPSAGSDVCVGESSKSSSTDPSQSSVEHEGILEVQDIFEDVDFEDV